MTETRIVTCPECGFQFSEATTGTVRTRTINPTDWLATCVGEVAAAQDCAFVNAETKELSPPDPSQASGR